jgi:hypothetical protein
MKFTQSFEITKWDQSSDDEAGQITLGRATVGKNFSDGELVGTSAAELLMVGTEAGPAAYTAVERFTGTVLYEHDDQGPRVTVDYELA